MRTQGPSWTGTRTYQAQVAGLKRGYAVVVGAADNQVNAPAGAGARCVGIITDVPQAPDLSGNDNCQPGDSISVAVRGEAVAIVGAAVVAGDYLKCDATGRLIPTAAAGEEIIARAVSSQATVGDKTVVEITPFIR